MRTVHSLNAFNTARGAENPLHSDEAAKRLGYQAGLIGGVDMYGYLTYSAIQRWGRSWLDQGAAECFLLKPVYEGDACAVVVTQDLVESLTVELHTRGEICARAEFFSPVAHSHPPPLLERREAPKTRPNADSESLAQGTLLPTLNVLQDELAARQFLLDERDDHEIYLLDGLSHPGYLLRLCNFTLSRNFQLGPWIHTASNVRNYQSVPVGEPLEVRSQVSAHYEQRGHLMVDIQVQLILSNMQIASSVTHCAIYRMRNS